MMKRWSVKQKFVLCIGLIGVIVLTLSVSGMISVYAYRDVVRTLSFRAAELPKAHRLLRSVTALSDFCQHRSGLPRIPHSPDDDHNYYQPVAIRQEFTFKKMAVDSDLEDYQEQLGLFEPGTGISDKREELQALEKIKQCRARLEKLVGYDNWAFNDQDFQQIAQEVNVLKELSEQLPRHLQNNLLKLKGNVQGQYRTLIGLTITASAMSIALVTWLATVFYGGVMCPMRTLIRGSRRVASGDFQHRIELTTSDEMAELAAAMNAMTTRFCEVRDDLDRQVRERTREVVHSEKMASVGFLAAGVAHEINNPLQAIAMCSEALESRLQDIIAADDLKPDDEHNHEITVLRKYLRRIQDEAFRCKGITDKLLSYSRLGDAEKQTADLAVVLQDVIELVRAVRDYRGKRIEFTTQGPVLARVVTHEIKQVVLNLITNGLDSIDPDGLVKLELRRRDQHVELLVVDNGCGMTDEVKQHLFEPFFTRRRNGQGTGLGLSIIYRIIQDHGGTITAESAGPGQGSTFRILIPQNLHEERLEKQQAA